MNRPLSDVEAMAEILNSPWERDQAEVPTQTSFDAFSRIAQASMGSIGDQASDTYLLALSHELEQWNARVKEELARRIATHNELTRHLAWEETRTDEHADS